MRQLIVCLSAAVIAAGCSGSVSQSLAPTAPTSASGAARADVSAASVPLSVAPASVTFNTCPGAPNTQTITVSTHAAGAITASGATGCILSPASQDVAGTPGSGGVKTATFTVTYSGNACTPATFTDKKGNTVSVSVNLDGGDGSCWI